MHTSRHQRMLAELVPSPAQVGKGGDRTWICSGSPGHLLKHSQGGHTGPGHRLELAGWAQHLAPS